MSAATILTMANGKGIDLLAPKASDIDFRIIAEHIAKENRFNGATPGEAYSVAQHCVIGAQAIIKEGGTETEAAYFLLHDAKEGLWKDDPTPKKRAIAERIAATCGVTSDSILPVLDGLEDGIDEALHEAAGLAWPVPPEIAALVKYYDVRCFVTEWRDLMGGIEHPNWQPYAAVPPLKLHAPIKPCSWPLAESFWMMEAIKLLPALRVSRASCGGT